jgi:hypothetical protein
MTDHPQIAVKPQNETLTDAVDAAREAYEGVKLTKSRSDDAALDYVAKSAVLLREAQRDRAAFQALCKADKIKIGAKRPETLAIRLGAGDNGLCRPDWANAAAELVDKLAASLTAASAKQMIRETHGGIRA